MNYVPILQEQGGGCSPFIFQLHQNSTFMVGVLVLGEHLGCFPAKSEATFSVAWKWDGWRDKI